MNENLDRRLTVTNTRGEPTMLTHAVCLRTNLIGEATAHVTTRNFGITDNRLLIF